MGDKVLKEDREQALFIDGDLWLLAVAQFGDTTATVQWFRTPHPHLQGRTPGDVCMNEYSGDWIIRDLLKAVKNSTGDSEEY